MLKICTYPLVFILSSTSHLYSSATSSPQNNSNFSSNFSSRAGIRSGFWFFAASAASSNCCYWRSNQVVVHGFEWISCC
ncbi:hypothetical protein OIU79_005600 [Salix purpurea]|uniref:Uncharacterized protein n=1 Tax=Salix purpurea TaxID=77065 RepID=A0A9Q0Z103_SALPP|nr:hypothetical protein OIU79_005600 [Salix purpurea]